MRVGTLCLIDRRPRSLSDEDVDSLRTLAEMVDHELALLAQSTTDELTDIANRRGFSLVAEHLLALCRRNTQPATVISIDLDNFKAVNDNFEHDAGDAALSEFARLLVKAFRDSDIVARLGGDVFCILNSYTSIANMDVGLTRLETSFRASALLQQYPLLSWSAGAAEYDPADMVDIGTLMQAADTSMYETKQARANQASVRTAR